MMIRQQAPLTKDEAIEFDKLVVHSHAYRMSAYWTRVKNEFNTLDRFADLISFRFICPATCPTWYYQQGTMRLWNPYKYIKPIKPGDKPEGKV